MKNTLFLAAALAAISAVSNGQVTTDPVGFVTYSAPANSDAPVALPINRTPLLQSVVTGVSGNVVSISAGLTAGQLVYAAGVQTNHYYLSIKSASSAVVTGKWYEITGNTGATSNASITADSAGATTIQTQGLAAGDVVEVIPFWTLNTLLPSGGGVTVTTDVDAPQDQILILPQTLAGANLSPVQSSIYTNDLANVSAAGWYDAGTLADVGDVILIPDTYFIVRNKGAAQSITVTGSVPTSNKASSIVRLSPTKKQDNFLVNPFPVAIALQQTNLFESGGFTVTTDVDAPKDLLLVYQGTETGFNSQPSKAYIYTNDLNNVSVAGWYDASSLAGPFLITDKVIPVGGSFIVRKAVGAVGEVAWTTPKPY